MAPNKAMQILGDQLARLISDNNSLRQHWASSESDYLTRFIYDARTYDQLLALSDAYQVVDPAQRDGAIRRWLNWRISAFCEWYLCLAPGIVPHSNKKHPTIDLYINGTPFDVKVTVLPSRLKSEPVTDVLNDFYCGQSKGNRWAYNNRLFIAVDGTWRDKADLQRLTNAMDGFLVNRTNYLISGKKGLVAGLIIA